jgi:S1-C subfamily serine protease
VAVHHDPSQVAQALGLRLAGGPGLIVKTVMRGSAAEAAGLATLDEILAVQTGSDSDTTTWRLTSLDELGLYAGATTEVMLWVARDKRILQLPLRFPTQDTTVRLSITNAAAVSAWTGNTALR